MRLDRQSRLWLRLHGLLFTLALLVLLGVVAWLSTLHVWQLDISAGARQPLPEATVRLLERVEEPVSITAFVRPDDPLEAHVRQLVERYRRHQPGMTLQLVNPDLRPDLARDMGVDAHGELVVAYRGRTERVGVPSEPRVSAAIQRLLRRDDRPVLYLTGHGERSLRGQANHDLGAFGDYLRERGHQLMAVQPAATPAVSTDAEALVIAGPRADWLPVVEQRILAYLEAGGSLLWLMDERDGERLDFLLEYLGLTALPGTVVEPRAAELLGVDDPRLLVVDDYAGHPALRAVQGVSLLSGARALDLAADADPTWTVEILLRSEARHWNETGGLERPELQPELGEQQGPLLLGLGLRRDHPAGDGEQRIVVMGDADFLSNAWIGNGANLSLGLSLMDWLAEADMAGLMAGHAAPDQRLVLGQTGIVLLGFGLLLGVPGLCLGVASILWWRRRAA